MTAGDVYAATVKDGRFGAVRVLRVMKDGLRKGRDSCNLVCTTYLATKPPALDEPALHEILRRHRFEFGGLVSTTIIDEAPPSRFVTLATCR